MYSVTEESHTMEEIIDNIYVGDKNDAEVPVLQENNVKHVLNLACTCSDARDSKMTRNYVHIPLKDGAANERMFRLAVDTVQGFLDMAEDDARVLVHCNMGQSRSVAILATAVAIRENIDAGRVAGDKPLYTFDKAVVDIKEVRPIADPVDELRELGEQLVEEQIMFGDIQIQEPEGT